MCTALRPQRASVLAFCEAMSVSKALAEWGIYVTEMKGLAFY
jgi:hypothetical protein